MFVIGHAFGGDGIKLHQLGRGPRILAQDDIGGAQHIERAQGNIARIAQGRGDDIKTGVERNGFCIHASRNISARGLARKKARKNARQTRFNYATFSG